MEIKAYLEGIRRGWWLFILIAVFSWVIGGVIGNHQTSKYTTSTTISLNSALFASSAFPSNTVTLSVPNSYQARVDPPAVINTIIRAYPRLTISQLQQNILVNTDKSNQLLLISVTDITAQSAADIANYLARHFVNTQTDELKRQMAYYSSWLQQNISQLNQQIGTLSLQIQQLTPTPAAHGTTPPISASTAETIRQDQNQLNLDQRTLYSYQLASTEIQDASQLVKSVYVIMQPAAIPSAPTIAPLAPLLVQLIALLVGLFAALCLLIMMEYFHPCIRHKAEVGRIVGLPVLAELLHIFRFEEKRLLQLQAVPLRRRMESLRLLCAAIGAPAIKNKGRIFLITSPRKKRNFTLLLAKFLAYSGQQTLLIEADLDKPSLHRQIKLSGSCDLVTKEGRTLSFINSTIQPRLFLLAAAAFQGQNQLSTSADLIHLLPELQKTFPVIIIDAPPIDHATTHLLSTKATQVLLLVKKRRDSIKRLKAAKEILQQLKLQPQCILLH
jgi:capsular polysaccharide biosynthesis protein